MSVRRNIVTALLLLLPLTLAADEGMWMVGNLDRALEKKMKERGCKLGLREIYDADAEGASLSDAVVSLDFGCTGSFVSPEGLLITNHHCAYSDLHALSTPQKNLLEDGFWAYRTEEEIPIPGKAVQILKKVLDVTQEALELLEKGTPDGKKVGSRKLSFVLEGRYEEKTGLKAQLVSLWGGSQYCICLYQEYTDVRLVGAPPVCMAAFGGDVDNWQWPQQKCDFALYRVYAAADGKPAAYSADNLPLGCKNPLKICRKGLREGDFAMVLGYPGRTDRSASSFRIALQQEVIAPVVNEIRGERMRIMKEGMAADPAVRLKYAEKFFSLSNVQVLKELEKECCDRFGVIAEKQALEKELQEWIDADSARSARWGKLLSKLDRGYLHAARYKRNTAVYQETMVRASALSILAMRLSSRGSAAAKEWAELDLGLERRIFDHCVRTWYEKMDTVDMGPFQRSLFRSYGNDYARLAEDLWKGSPLTDGSLAALSGADSLGQSGKEWAARLQKDSLCRFFTDLKMTEVNKVEAARRLSNLDKEYRQALFEMRRDKGILQYPDANSTLRLTYGRTGRFAPKGAAVRPWYTLPSQILKKENPDVYEFALLPGVKDALKAAAKKEKGCRGLKVDFITDNDITGGNSGSPVLNARGELVGLAFDGNAESLASDYSFTPGWNKCVCVDIRYVLWTLETYAGFSRIVEELGK
ncbi:MAG: S46 family peptidase [Bacteroidales bacterium]|nr:S46 family peptidase [Bacteroidales bacterium]